MFKAVISFYDSNISPLSVTVGTSEDVKAPRALAALAKAGWEIDDAIRTSFKAFLAGKRQGDIGDSVKFEDWVDGVEDVDIRPSVKQINEAVLLGTLTREQGDELISNIEVEEGEAAPPRSY